MKLAQSTNLVVITSREPVGTLLTCSHAMVNKEEDDSIANFGNIQKLSDSILRLKNLGMLKLSHS